MNRQSDLEQLAWRIKQADAIVIGGGSGLSSAAGYDYYHWSPVLARALEPFRDYYGFASPFAGFYHCFSSYGEQWGYYSQYIRAMWETPTGQPYLDLQRIIRDKPTFVLTTNNDPQHHQAPLLAADHSKRNCLLRLPQPYRYSGTPAA